MWKLTKPKNFTGKKQVQEAENLSLDAKNELAEKANLSLRRSDSAIKISVLGINISMVGMLVSVSDAIFTASPQAETYSLVFAGAGIASAAALWASTVWKHKTANGLPDLRK